MGWAVGEDTEHDRFRGYGVPAWCDAYSTGCREKIDRGLGYTCEDGHRWRYETDAEGNEVEIEDLDWDPLAHPIFVCGKHSCKDVDENDLPPEHPEWITHVLAHESWAQWRDQYPEKVDKYQESLETQRKLGVLTLVEDVDDPADD